MLAHIIFMLILNSLKIFHLRKLLILNIVKFPVLPTNIIDHYRIVLQESTKISHLSGYRTLYSGYLLKRIFIQIHNVKTTLEILTIKV